MRDASHVALQVAIEAFQTWHLVMNMEIGAQ